LIETIFRGGLIVDGSGHTAFHADVAVSGEKILDIGNLEDSSAVEVVNISGMVLAPGFIDIHTHSDLTLISNPLAQSKIRQGVTTELVGNCGFGVAPIPPGVNSADLRAAVAYLDLDPSVTWEWETLAEYLNFMDRTKTSLNVATLVGHIPIHAAVVGYGREEATVHQIDQMKDLLGESLTHGAFGLSTGLNYAPVSYASENELVGLAEVVAEHDSFFAWHMRNYADDLMRSVKEVIDIAMKTGVRTQISHLVSVGQRNWGKVSQALDEIDKANSKGAEISVDVYPYIAGNCPLSQLLPDWAQEGGDQAMQRRLIETTIRSKVLKAWDNPLFSWNDIQISSVLPGRENFVGRTITEIADSLNQSQGETALDLLANMGNSVGIIAFGRDEGDVRAVLNHPAALLGSDGQSLDPNGATGSGSPHPRSYGTFPRLFHSYVGTHGISLERAVQISTSLVAEKLHLPNRGEIKRNAQADIVVFDPLRIKDLSTYENPHQYPIGISHVMVNGKLTIKNGEHLGTRNGRVLRKID
jgi:N-acyl-D-aspartate/D-glutamate deacylase